MQDFLFEEARSNWHAKENCSMTFSDHKLLSPQASAELEMFFQRPMSECVLLVAALSGMPNDSASITKPGCAAPLLTGEREG